jgi:WD40 repeat protein
VQLIDPPTGRPLATLAAPDPQLISWLCFSPDGGRLAVACEGRVVQVWDLRSIRRKLAAMNLDWDLPPLPPSVATSEPVSVRISPGALEDDPRSPERGG